MKFFIFFEKRLEDKNWRLKVIDVISIAEVIVTSFQ